MATDGVPVDGAQLTAMMRTMAQTCKAVGIVAETSNLSRHDETRELLPSEGIVASMSAPEGSWQVSCSFTRDNDGNPTQPKQCAAKWLEGGDNDLLSSLMHRIAYA